MHGLRATHVFLCFAAALAPACDPPKPRQEEKPKAARPAERGLAFVEVPAAIRLNARFRVAVELRDDGGAARAKDDETQVTISATGTGALRGTLTQTAAAGRVVFDDLSFDKWEPIRLTVAATGFASSSTSVPIPVRPLLRFASRPPNRFLVGEDTGKFAIELVDGLGRSVKSENAVRLTPEPDDFDVDGGPDHPLTEGTATFPSLRFKSLGAKTLVWTSPGLADLLLSVTVFAEQREQGLWVPAARVGVDYKTELAPAGADFRLLRGSLPKGFSIEPSGLLHGFPTAPQYARFEVVATIPGQSPMLSRVEFPIYPAQETRGAPLDDLGAPGPYEVASLDDLVPIRARNVKAPMRAFYPARGGKPADGVFPLVVFHHGAGIVDAARPRLYDQYDHFLRHWASHGFVVATVDATDLVWENRRWVPGSLANLDAMAENLRATIAHVAKRETEPSFTLHGHVDATRVVVAGHSRGAAAAIIAARADPRVVGGVLIKPLDPANTVGGSATWTGPLPPKPFLLVAAGNDGDLPYPMVDYLFERRAAPMVEVTILGSLHYYSVADGGPQAKFDEGTTPGVTRHEDWDVTNAYAVAFLKYAASCDLDMAQRLFGGAAASCSLTSGGVIVQSDRRAESLLVDDFQDDNPGRNSFDLPNHDENMTVSADEPSLVSAIRTFSETYRRMYSAFYQRPDILAASSAHRLEWRLGPATYRLTLPSLDVKGRAAFVLRARTLNGRFDDAQMRIAFTDDAGKRASVPLKGHVGAAGLRSRFADVVVPVSEIAAAGLDMENIASVEIVLDGVGALLIDDLRFE
jgi:dienelactone hydrolase